MFYASARRLSDGLLSWAQVTPGQPDWMTVINNAAAAFGGAINEWEYVEFSAEQYQAMLDALPGRSYLNNDILTSKPKPIISADKTQLEDDGADLVTITFDVGDGDYTGEIIWKVTAPDGEVTTETENMAAGVATLEITTVLIGSIHVQAETVKHGVGLIQLEGV